MTTVAEKLAPRLARPLFDFAVPEEDREWESDPASFTLQQLTTLQEMDAANEAGTDGAKFLMARINRALVAINGQAVDHAYTPTDNFSPKVREYLVAAYLDISSVKPEARAAFLASKNKRMP